MTNTITKEQYFDSMEILVPLMKHNFALLKTSMLAKPDFKKDFDALVENIGPIETALSQYVNADSVMILLVQQATTRPLFYAAFNNFIIERNPITGIINEFFTLLESHGVLLREATIAEGTNKAFRMTKEIENV